MSILASTETEYGVRVAIPGEPERIEPVGSPHLADERIRDVHVNLGGTGRLVRRLVTPWEDA